MVASAGANVVSASDVSWHELAVRLAARTVSLASDRPAAYCAPGNAEARVTRIVRSIDAHPEAPLTLEIMARNAKLSPYHFLRTFERLTGVTPHQYIVRARLREAAIRLSTKRTKILDIALDCGFGDVSNFNRTFRTEFGVSPGDYRKVRVVAPAGATDVAP
jgi:AraC family transcriptional regulator